MKVLLTYLRNGLTFWKLNLPLYFVQVVIALFILTPLSKLLSDALGRTNGLERISHGWDYRIISDLLYHFSEEIDRIQSLLLLLIPIYLIVTTIISGGVWASVKEGEFRWRVFAAGCKRYVGKFLLYKLIAIVSMVGLSALLWIPYATNVMHWLEYAEDERYVFYGGVVIFALWLIGIISIMTIEGYYKAKLVDGSTTKSTLKQVFNRGFGSLVSVSLIAVLFTWLVLYMEAMIGVSTIGILLIVILYQQIIIYLRIGMKVGTIGYFLHLASGN